MTHAALKGRKTHVEVLTELRNDVNPEGADPYGHMMAEALDAAIAALSAMEGEAVAWQGRNIPDGEWTELSKPVFDAMKKRGHAGIELRALYTAPPPQQAEPADTGHSCSYYCDRPECVKAQRDELREKYVARQSEGMVCIGWEFNDPRDGMGWQRLHGVGPESSPPYADPVQVRRIFAAAPADAEDVP